MTLNKELILDVVYPVGSIYMSVNSTNPSTLFGGTWERLKDRFLLGCGDTYSNGATGGSADAVVVSHTHMTRVSRSQERNPSGQDTYTFPMEKNWWVVEDCAGGNTQGTVPVSVASTGESGTGKNMPPYLAVYMWKRTS